MAIDIEILTESIDRSATIRVFLENSDVPDELRTLTVQAGSLLGLTVGSATEQEILLALATHLGVSSKQEAWDLADAAGTQLTLIWQSYKTIQALDISSMNEPNKSVMVLLLAMFNNLYKVY
jgi:hypothetical protein